MRSIKKWVHTLKTTNPKKGLFCITVLIHNLISTWIFVDEPSTIFQLRFARCKLKGFYDKLNVFLFSNWRLQVKAQAFPEPILLKKDHKSNSNVYSSIWFVSYKKINKWVFIYLHQEILKLEFKTGFSVHYNHFDLCGQVEKSKLILFNQKADVKGNY